MKNLVPLALIAIVLSGCAQLSRKSPMPRLRHGPSDLRVYMTAVGDAHFCGADLDQKFSRIDVAEWKRSDLRALGQTRRSRPIGVLFNVWMANDLAIDFKPVKGSAPIRDRFFPQVDRWTCQPLERSLAPAGVDTTGPLRVESGGATSLDTLLICERIDVLVGLCPLQDDSCVLLEDLKAQCPKGSK